MDSTFCHFYPAPSSTPLRSAPLPASLAGSLVEDLEAQVARVREVRNMIRELRMSGPLATALKNARAAARSKKAPAPPTYGVAPVPPAYGGA